MVVIITRYSVWYEPVGYLGNSQSFYQYMNLERLRTTEVHITVTE
jgi:hypothetical protein